MYLDGLVSLPGIVGEKGEETVVVLEINGITNLYVMEVRKQIAVGTRQSVGQEGLFV